MDDVEHQEKATKAAREADRLWPEARARALAWCAETLRRLRRGEGRFYDHDDFVQDLYLEFRETVAAYLSAIPDDTAVGTDDGTVTAPESLEALWASWSRRLWRGGLRILRRAPQRLWTAEAPLQRSMFLAPPSDNVLEALAALDELEEALWAISPFRRQLLYMLCLQRWPVNAVIDCLGLAGRDQVYKELYRARRALRQALLRRKSP
ncbi:MAG: hypothetical protein H5T69_08670 [Chloroflexi bacterium]|nr:hypothetical protein [Chloroflexota bacterium]